MGKRKLQAVDVSAASHPKQKARRLSVSAMTTVATDSTDPNAAATAVFMTTELLERVLSFLPMKDLLLDQRVCSKWLKVIEASPELQQNLFFQPREAHFQWCLFENEKGEGQLKVVPKDYRSESESVCPSAEPNPLLFCNDHDNSVHESLYEAMFYGSGSKSEQTIELRQPLPTLPGSWSRMFLSQPPAKGWSYYWMCPCNDCAKRSSNDGDISFRGNHNVRVNELCTELDKHRVEHGADPEYFCVFTQGVLFPNDEELRTHGMI